MGLSWQQGSLGRTPNGAFITTTPMPERMLYAEPLRRRTSVELAGSVVARTDDAVLLFEPGRYPVAYFPTGDVAAGVLEPTDRRTTHPDLGETHWFDVVRGDGEITRRAAWQHVDPPAQAAMLRDTVAFAWRAMDAYDIGGARNAARSYRAPFDAMARIADLVFFEPDKVTVTLDGETLEPAPGRTVVARGPDRNLAVDEIGGVRLLEAAVVAAGDGPA
jgi:uncharacterized protein (DUF427 family)